MKLVTPAVRRERVAVRQARPVKTIKSPTKVLKRRKRKVHGKLYSTKRWQELRRRKLSEAAVCERCGKMPAAEVDHITPHRGDERLFYDFRNLQTMCKPCHVAKTIFEKNLAVRFPDPSEPIPTLRYESDMNGDRAL